MVRSVRTARGISKSQESASKWRPRRPTNGAKAMPRRNSLISRLRHGRAWDEWDEKGHGEEAAAAPASAGTRPRSRRRRVAVAVTFASLFVAGAAFSAAAGDEVRSTLEGTALSSAAASDGATADATTPDATTPDGTTSDGTTTDGTAPTVPDPGAVPAPADDSDLSPAGDATGDSGDSAAPDTAVPPAAAPVGTPAASAGAPPESPVREAPQERRPRRSRQLGADARRPSGRGPQRCGSCGSCRPSRRRGSHAPGGHSEVEPVGGDVLVLQGHLVRRPGRRALALLPRSRAPRARERARRREGSPWQKGAERPSRLDLRRRTRRHRIRSRQRPRARSDRVPSRLVRPGDGVLPDQRAPALRAARSHLGAHLRACCRHQRGRRDADLRPPAAGRDHRARRPRHASATARADAEAGHLSPRARRTFLPAGQPLRPHSHRLLKTWGKPGFPHEPPPCVESDANRGWRSRPAKPASAHAAQLSVGDIRERP